MEKQLFFSKVPQLEDDRLTLRHLTMSDAPGLRALISAPEVYRYLPTFLFEKKYEDTGLVISRMYSECLEESLILGIFMNDAFCGLAEMYGYRGEILKISVGYRLLPQFWKKGIATEALGMMVRYLYGESGIEIITASTMIENTASARVLEKNGFCQVVHAVPEDWGYDTPTITDKWIR